MNRRSFLGGLLAVVGASKLFGSQKAADAQPEPVAEAECGMTHFSDAIGYYAGIPIYGDPNMPSGHIVLLAMDDSGVELMGGIPLWWDSDRRVACSPLPHSFAVDRR